MHFLTAISPLFFFPILCWHYPPTAYGQEQPTSEGPSSTSSALSPCLQKCLEPMARIEKSISNMYRNYEKVCEKLEWSANCAQGCLPEDRGAFFQYTTFYRIHCVDFEEELEEHLPCLREAAYKADVGRSFSFHYLSFFIVLLPPQIPMQFAAKVVWPSSRRKSSRPRRNGRSSSARTSSVPPSAMCVS